MSDSTKYAFAHSLYNLLDKKPLDKITITDITNDCGLNRQTFYYHFHDIYALIEWIYTTEADKAIGDNKTYRTWQEGLEDVLNAMLKDKEFLLKTYHSKSGGHLADIIMSIVYKLLIGVVNEVCTGYPIDNEKREFIAEFYKYAYAGMIMEWVAGGMKESPEEIVDNFEYIMNGNILNAVKKYNIQERKKIFG